MPEINLLQGDQKRKIQISHVGSAARPLFWILIVIFVVELGAYLWVKKQKSDVQNTIIAQQTEIDEAQREITGRSEEIQSAVKAQFALKNFSELLDTHVHWTKAWDELSRHTLKTVRFTTLQATDDSTQFIVGGNTISFTELGKVMLGMQNSPEFTEVMLLNSTPSEKEENTIEFELQVKFKKELLET